MYRTLAKLIANGTLRGPNSAQVVRASCHQWKPVSVGACLASSSLLNTHPGNSFKRRMTPKIQPYSRFGDLPKQTPTSTLIVSATSSNSNIRARFEGLVLNQRLVYNKYKRLLNKHRKILVASLVGSGLVTFVIRNFETIPYSKRTHFILVPRWFENILVEIVLESVLKDYKSKVLPSTDPTSERTLIAESLIKALEKGLTQEKVWGWKQGCNMREARRQYLKQVEWEVVIIDDPDIFAFSLPDGKIYLHTGLIEYFKSDAEIATIIAHEIGHVVARTAAEKLTMYIGLVIPRLIKYTYNFYMPHVAQIKTNYDLVEASLSRKLELEADYIGLLLMASAGYNPVMAIIVWHKFAEIEDHYNETSTHPSSKMRVQLVVQALEEAMLFYDES